MRERPASTNLHRTISGERAPGSATRQAANSTRSSFYLDTSRCKPPSDTLAASSGSATPSTIGSGYSRNANSVATASGRVADQQDTIREKAHHVYDQCG